MGCREFTYKVENREKDLVIRGIPVSALDGRIKSKHSIWHYSFGNKEIIHIYLNCKSSWLVWKIVRGCVWVRQEALFKYVFQNWCI